MVAEQVFGDVNNLAVHPNFLSGVLGLEVLPTGGVRAGGAFGEEPFVFCEAGVVVGVDYGVFALRQWNAAKGIAVAQAAIEKGQPD